MNTPKRRILAGALALTLVAAACGSDDDATATTDAPEATEAPESTDDMTETTDDMGETTEAPAGGGDVSGSIFVSGSSTVEPISIAAGNAFSDANPDVAITVDGPGTGDGFAQFCAGETDISDASRAISEEESRRLRSRRHRVHRTEGRRRRSVGHHLGRERRRRVPVVRRPLRPARTGRDRHQQLGRRLRRRRRDRRHGDRPRRRQHPVPGRDRSRSPLPARSRARSTASSRSSSSRSARSSGSRTPTCAPTTPPAPTTT